VISADGVTIRSDGRGPAQTYEEHATTHAAGGVSETTRAVSDFSGSQRVTVERQLGDRGRAVMRERLPDGRQRARASLRNVDHDRTAEFDQDWRAEASRHALPVSDHFEAVAGSTVPNHMRLAAGSSERTGPLLEDASHLPPGSHHVSAQRMYDVFLFKTCK